MGYEHKLNFRVDSKEEVERLVRMQTCFDREYEHHGRGFFEFRTEVNAGEMPDAHALIEDDGIHFCDNGTGAEILKELQQTLSVHFGEVKCHEV